MTALLIRAFRPALLYLLLPSLFMGAGMFIGGDRTTEEIARESGNFYYAVGTLFCIWLFLKKRREKVLQEISLSVPEDGRKKILLLGAMGLSFSVGISALLTLLPEISWLWGNYTSFTSTAFYGYDRLLMALTNVLLAPVMEEVVFRGFMIKRLETELSVRWAVLISTVFFALCHIYPVWILYAFAMGMVLSWIAVRENNIFYSVVFHIGFNLAAFLISLINISDRWNRFLSGSWWKILILGTAAAAAAILTCRRYVKEEDT